jgi:hypothetical protein
VAVRSLPGCLDHTRTQISRRTWVFLSLSPPSRDDYNIMRLVFLPRIDLRSLLICPLSLYVSRIPRAPTLARAPARPFARAPMCRYGDCSVLMRNTPPLEGVFNFREAGGIPTADGTRRIRPGVLYRSGAMNRMTDADLRWVCVEDGGLRRCVRWGGWVGV